MTLALNGTAIHGSFGSSGTPVTTFTSSTFTTTVPNTIIIIDIHINNTGTIAIPTATGLTFALRSNTTIGTTGSLARYWALATSTFSSTITEPTFGTSVSAGEYAVYAISGANLASPWDPNVGLPFTHTNSGSAKPVVTGVNTSSSNDFIISAATTDTTLTNPGTPGGFFVQIANQTNSNGPSQSEYTSGYWIAAQQTNQTFTWTGTVANSIATIDAIQAAPIPRAPTYNPLAQVNWYQSWTYAQQLTPAGTVQNPFNQTNWPNPQPVTWYQSYTQYLPLEQPLYVYPKYQYDWPNPSPISWYQDWSHRLTPLQLLSPFRQTDYPNPLPVQWYRDWEWRQVDKLGLDVLPNRLTDFPNPLPVSWYQTWIQSVQPQPPGAPISPVQWPLPIQVGWYRDSQQNLPVSFYAPIQAPLNQLDWKLPLTQQWYQTWLWRQVDKLGLDQLPVRQQNWPNPTPISWYLTWQQSPRQQTPSALPFNQYDWKLPYPIYWYMDQELNLQVPLYFVPPVPPTNIYYEQLIGSTLGHMGFLGMY
jgi:hypothetical protein